MDTTIILSVLKTKSSYRDDTELLVDDPSDVPDTLQWYITGSLAYRIRTYSIDHDIHVFKVGPTNDDLVKLAIDNNTENFGDIIESQHIFEFDTIPDENTASERLREKALPGMFRSVSDTYLFWSPDEVDYLSQSEPS